MAPPPLDNQAGIPSSLGGQAPASPVASNGTGNGGPSGNAAGLDIPSVPSNVYNGYTQDIPTLSPAKKPAA